MTWTPNPAAVESRVEPDDSLDDFPTPPWAGRAFCHYVLAPHFDLSRQTVWEPACNRGYLVRGLTGYFRYIRATDIHYYGRGTQDWQLDFLSFTTWQLSPTDWIITNPPFRLAEAFVAQMRLMSKIGFAVFVRTSFLETVGRYRNLFRQNPPTIIAQYSERVSCVKGCYDPNASRPTSYCWLVWIHGAEPRPTMWIPPCKKTFMRPEDVGPL